MAEFSPFSCPIFLPHFLGAPRSEWLLLPKRAAAYGGNPNGVREEPGKQKTRSCRTEEPEAVPEKMSGRKGRPAELGTSVRYRPRHVNR